MNESYPYYLYDTFREAVDNYGMDITIWWRRSTSFPSASTSDPVYGGYMNPNAGDDGSKIQWYSTPKNIKGILYKFSKGLKSIEDGRLLHKVANFGDARITCWMDDVLVNLHSMSGPTYFQNCHTVESLGIKYTVKNTERVGFGEEMMVIATLTKVD